MIQRLITIRKEQMKIFEDMTMFEQQILCHKVPNNLFNSIQVDHIDQKEQCVANKRQQHKIIQDLKRRMLNVKLEKYEIQIQNYETQYEEELIALKSKTFDTNSSYQMCHFNELIHLIQTYVYHYTNILIRQTRYKESCLHVKLIRHHRRFCRRRHQSSTTAAAATKMIDVYPQTIVDVPKVSLNPIQLEYLSRTGKFKLLFNDSLSVITFFFILQDPHISDQIKVIFTLVPVDINESKKSIRKL
jgi:hypothetical protein